MLKMKKLSFLIVLSILTILLHSCKTTEENYRSAYDRAKAARDSSATESAIYGRGRTMGAQTIVAEGDTIECRIQRVALTEPIDDSVDFSDRFNVVVGQFKQEFNAKSMCKRLRQAGYENAVVVQNGEPYYFVLLSSHETRQAAIEALKAIPDDFPIRMRAPLPYILFTP